MLWIDFGFAKFWDGSEYSPWTSPKFSDNPHFASKVRLENHSKIQEPRGYVFFFKKNNNIVSAEENCLQRVKEDPSWPFYVVWVSYYHFNLGVTGARTSVALQNIGRLLSFAREAAPHAKEVRAACFRASHHVDPMLRITLPSCSLGFAWPHYARTQEPTWVPVTYPRLWMRLTASCTCTVTHNGAPSSYNRRLRQVDSIAQHPDEVLATYVKNNWNTWIMRQKHLQDTRKTWKHVCSHCKPYETSIWNTCNICIKHLKHLTYGCNSRSTFATSRLNTCNIRLK
jgi:hypothetical protein